MRPQLKRPGAIPKPELPGTAGTMPYPLFAGAYAIAYGAILVAMALFDVAGAP